MKKTTRNLLICGAGVLVLGGAVAALLLTNPGGEEESSAPAAETVSLISRPEEDLASLHVENEKGSYTITTYTVEEESTVTNEDGEEETVVETDTENRVDELGDLPYSTYVVDAMYETGYSLNASKDVGEVENLGDYGLADPQATVTANYTDGTSFTLLVGSASAGDAASYYVCADGESHVYVASLDERVFFAAEEFVRDTITNIQSADGESTPVFTELTLSGANFPEPITVTGNDAGLTTAASAGKSADIDSTTVNNVTTALCSLSAQGAAVLHPTEEQLAEYGFTEPRAVAEFTAEGAEYRLVVGGSLDAKTDYVMLDGRDVIYTVAHDNVSAWTDVTAFEMMTKFILLPMITDVDRMTVTLEDGVEHEFIITREVDEDRTTEDRTAYNYTVTGDGEPVTYENFQTYYQSVIMVQLIEPTDEVPTVEPNVSVTYEYYDDTGKEPDCIEFYEQRDRRYLVTLNGEVCGITPTSSAQIFEDFTPRILVDELLPEVI